MTYRTIPSVLKKAFATPPLSREVFIQALKSVRITSALFHFVISLGPERVLHFDLVLSVFGLS